VLPFNNMSGDAEQEYFSDGMSEDIITDLSKIAGLRVIARNSSFVYKGRSVDIRAVGRELGVTSVLEGSIRRAGNRVRITAQLIEAATGSHLWAERYDRDLNDIFEVQDDVTRRIVDALKVTLTPAEAAELTTPSAAVSVEAHDAVLRAREMLRQPNKDRALFEQMVVLFKRAIDLDPDNSDAYAGLAMAHGLDFQNGWSTTPEVSRNLALQLAQTAIAKNPKNAFARYVASLGFAFNGRSDLALREVEIALELEPNNAQAFNARGAARIFTGDPRAAIPDIERGMSLDPGFSQQYLHFLGIAHYMLGNYETAAAHFRERILLAPRTDFSRAFLVATLGQLGDKAGAAVIWRELMDVNPQYTVRSHIDHLAFQRPADKEQVAEGFRKAGYL
jgi:adenylate cyclase